MENAWKTQWQEGRKLFAKRFDGEKPTHAVEFGKDLKRRGIEVVDVISVRRAFPPPLKHLQSPKPGFLWCPYCLKWRGFEESEVVYPDFTTPNVLRCPACGISVKDAYVRMYNPDLVIQYEMKLEMKQKQREQRRLNSKKERSPRGGMKRSRR